MQLLTKFRSCRRAFLKTTIFRLPVFPKWLRIVGFVDGYGQNAIAEFNIKIQLLDSMCHLWSNIRTFSHRLVMLHLQANRIQTFIFSQEFTLRRKPHILFNNIYLAIGSHSYIMRCLISFSKRGSLLLNRTPDLTFIDIFRFSALFSDLILGTAHQVGLLSNHTVLFHAHHFWSVITWAWHNAI